MATTPAEVHIRRAELKDLERITEIYNYYVTYTAINFDIAPFDWRKRVDWFNQFRSEGRHQLFVAEINGKVVGYAGSMMFRTKPAFNPTVELTLYLDRELRGGGIGKKLYVVLFAALEKEDVVTLVASIAMPADESVRFHERLGFKLAGVLPVTGRKFGTFWDTGFWVKQLPLKPGDIERSPNWTVSTPPLPKASL
jgi:phosphinothricin acetyltransferase